MNFQAYNKLIAALVVPAILAVLASFGVTAEIPVGEAVGLGLSTLLTAFFVWLVPNKH